MIVSESDDHALEEALILKERYGGKVTAIALDAPEVDDALFAALAKGVDRVVKIVEGPRGVSTNAAAKVFAEALRQIPGLMPADLILVGTQAIDDLDGLIAPLVSHHLGLPFMGIVTGVTCDAAAGTAVLTREFPSGVRGEYGSPLPAVVGMQAAEKPPRYVPVAKVRAVMKSQSIESAPAPSGAAAVALEVVQLAKPKVAAHAEMLEGSPEDVAGKLCGILGERGLL
jgi:electron transfer flavoprotein beta subunit